jgi:2-polyprenyl-6-methoxyphenol hydroxylase-like FAD-dependent oxidoreductase
MNSAGSTSCCIVGGGPAGIMLGYLLARSDVPVTVMEKHTDFFRDFRGDTVHPSTLQVMHELGLLHDLLALPHQKISSVRGVFGDYSFEAANLEHVPALCKFVALMPQWDFLNFISGRAKRFPSFRLEMQHEVTDLLWDRERVVGVRATTPEGPVDIQADLVIGCDGRHSVTRVAAKLPEVERGVPIDVLWFRISRHQTDPDQLFGNINYGKALILINRGDYFQSGLLIRKGSLDEIRWQGMQAFRGTVRQIAPFLGDRVDELTDWNQIQLLSVQINRLERWHRPGLLCIGDAAHAMSPAGGVGINLAIQDAVAAARILTPYLREGTSIDSALPLVQRRREFPTRVTQQIQVFAHAGIARIFEMRGPAKAPWQLKAVTSIPGIQRVVGRVIGIGVRPEHVEERGKVGRTRAGELYALFIAVRTGLRYWVAASRSGIAGAGSGA